MRPKIIKFRTMLRLCSDTEDLHEILFTSHLCTYRNKYFLRLKRSYFNEENVSHNTIKNLLCIISKSVWLTNIWLMAGIESMI